MQPSPSPRSDGRDARVSRKASWVLLAAALWTLYVWISRVVILAGQDEPAGFKVVHFALAAVSLAVGVAVGVIGWRSLRASRRDR
jgi:hypothetical protein